MIHEGYMKQILPVISIVVPTYNEEKYIKLCLDSLHRQSLEPAEIIVVDNNSTDRTIAVSYTHLTLPTILRV